MESSWPEVKESFNIIASASASVLSPPTRYPLIEMFTVKPNSCEREEVRLFCCVL